MKKRNNLFIAGLLILMLSISSCEKKKAEGHTEEQKNDSTKPVEEKKVAEQENHVAENPSAGDQVKAKTEESNHSDDAKVVAEFSSGHKILMKDLLDQMKDLPAEAKDKPFSKLYSALLNKMVDSYLLSEAAKKAGLESDSATTKKADDAKKIIIQKAFIDSEVAKIIKEGDIKAKYDELVSKMPKDEFEVRLRHVMLSSKDEAEALIKDLKSNPRNFEEVAKTRSLDDQTKMKGGDLGFVRKGDLPRALAEVVFTASKGEVLAKAIDLGNQKFSVIYIDDKRPVQPPKFEEVKEDIRKALIPEFAVKVVEKIKSDSGVKLYGLDGKLIEQKDEKDKEKKQPNVDVAKLDQAMVVAEFKDGKKITLAEVKEQLKDLPDQFKSISFVEIFEPLLNRLVDNHLLYNKATEAGFDKNSDVLKNIVKANEAVLQKAYLDKNVQNLVTDQLIKKKYEELKKLLPKGEMEARIRHILVKTKEQADLVMKELKAGAKFDDLITKYSVDEKTKADKGDIGYVKRSDLPKELGDAVFNAAKATVIPNPVNLGEVGWSIIRVEDKRPVEPPSFEEVKPELSKIVYAEKSMDFITKMRGDAKVKMFDIDGKETKATEATAEEKSE
jgi:peptidyl-prolyl cis-trans isomerase C